MKKKPEMMGFESDKRIVKVMRNRPSTEIVGGKTCHFRSQLEWKWAQYLQFLKESGEIIEWNYEPRTFYFFNEKTAPVQYTPDFRIDTEDSHYWQECKGYHDGQTNTKFRRMAKHFPCEKFELVLQRIPKKSKHKGASRRRIAAKYVRRIIDASEIFKQMKGVIQ